jgi:hypothetical protein
MKTWKDKPSDDEVRVELQAFFDTLRTGKLDEAEAMVAHAYPDWNESIYALFQDHYLIHATPADSSFEGNAWKTDRAWLADLTIGDNVEWMGKNRNVLWVDIVYRGEASGYVGEFMLQSGDVGFFLERQAFKMA